MISQYPSWYYTFFADYPPALVNEQAYMGYCAELEIDINKGIYNLFVRVDPSCRLSCTRYMAISSSILANLDIFNSDHSITLASYPELFI